MTEGYHYHSSSPEEMIEVAFGAADAYRIAFTHLIETVSQGVSGKEANLDLARYLKRKLEEYREMNDVRGKVTYFEMNAIVDNIIGVNSS